MEIGIGAEKLGGVSEERCGVFDVGRWINGFDFGVGLEIPFGKAFVDLVIEDEFEPVVEGDFGAHWSESGYLPGVRNEINNVFWVELSSKFSIWNFGFRRLSIFWGNDTTN